MRRKNYYLTAGLFGLFLLGVSCSSDPAHVPPPPGEGILTMPELTLSAETIEIDPEQLDRTALHVAWSAATDDEELRVHYSLYVNLAEGDMFTDPLVFDAGSALSYDFTHETLNRLLIADLRVGAGSETPLRFAVYAEHPDDEFDTQLSAIRTCVVTPRTTYPDFPPSLIMVGAATPWQWDLEQGLEISETAPGSHRYTASDIALRVQPMSLNNGFKLYFSRSREAMDDPRFAAQDLGSDLFGRSAIYHEGDAQFQPGSFGYENGLYEICMDLDALELTLTRTGDLPGPTLPEQLFLLGDTFTWGWSWDGTPLTKIADGIYRAEMVEMTFGDRGDRGFKMYERRDDWSVYYAMADDAAAERVTLQRVTNGDAPQVYPGKLGFKDGVYDLEVNLDRMILTLTERIDYSTACSMTGEATPGGWDRRTYLPLKAENVWEATGIRMNFDDEYKGFKIFASYDGWWPWYGQRPDADFGAVIRIDDQTTSDTYGDPQFYPGRAGYVSGVYTVNLDLNTMTLTLTPEN